MVLLTQVALQSISYITGYVYVVKTRSENWQPVVDLGLNAYTIIYNFLSITNSNLTCGALVHSYVSS